MFTNPYLKPKNSLIFPNECSTSSEKPDYESPASNSENNIQENCSNSDTLKWQIEKYEEGFILNKTKRAIENKQRREIIESEQNWSPSQTWVFHYIPNEKHLLITQGNRCITNNGGEASVGQGYHIQSCEIENENQWFSLGAAEAAVPKGWFKITSMRNCALAFSA